MDEPPKDDEFAGCALEDVALAVAHNERGSEEQKLAIKAFLRRVMPPQTPSMMGHNAAPLSEVLVEELEPYRKRRDALVETAAKAAITDDESASKVVDLAQMCRAYEKEIDDRRKQLVEPHRKATELINNSHNSLRFDVQVARQGMNGTSGLRGMLTAWDDKKRAAAAEARAAAEREAEAKRIASEDALQRADQMQGARGGVTAELAAMSAAEAAAEAQAAAERVQAAPTRGHLGQVSRKRQTTWDVIEPRVFVDWLLEQPQLCGRLLTALHSIAGEHLRSLGVEAVERGIDIPGVSARVERGVANVRR